MPRSNAPNFSPRIENRKARHDYHIEQKLECGIVLVGSEVKAIRHGQVSLAEGFAQVDARTGKLLLYQVDIGPYEMARGHLGHEAKRPRILLAHKREIAKLLTASAAKGFTLVPLALYFVRGKVKVEIGLAHGKQAHDKRQDMRARDADREIRRAMSRKLHG